VDTYEKHLLDSLNDRTLCVQSRQQVAIVYIDFRKAFDVISHHKLLARLHSYGIRGSLLLWLKNYLLIVLTKRRLAQSFRRN